MPYSYLLDDSSREQAGVQLENAIIIIDEAHNIKSFAEESSNFEISVEQLKGCLKEIDWVEGDGSSSSGEQVRDLVNHWINFISETNEEAFDGVVYVNNGAFPKDALVLEEKEVI